MILCDWWSRFNRFRNFDGFYLFILILFLIIVEYLELKGGFVSFFILDV